MSLPTRLLLAALFSSTFGALGASVVLMWHAVAGASAEEVLQSLSWPQLLDLGLKGFEALATVALLMFAAMISARIYWLEDTPVLVASRRNGSLRIENVGRAPAVGVYVQLAEFPRQLRTVGPVAAGKKRMVSGALPRRNALAATHVFARSLTGRWWRTKVTTPLLSETEDEHLDNKVERVGAWRVPLDVLAAARVEARTIVEAHEAYSTWLSRDGFRVRSWRLVSKGISQIDRRLVRSGEAERLRRHQNDAIADRPSGEGQEERAGWPFDASSFPMPCHHTNSAQVDQYRCQKVKGGWLALIRLSKTSEPRVVYGHMFVADEALAVEDEQEQRSRVLSNALADYLCALTPVERFAFEVWRYPPPKRFWTRLLKR